MEPSETYSFPQALDELRRSDKNIRCGGYGVRNRRLTFTFASTRRVDMTGFDMEEKDFRSGRQWSVRDQGQGFKGHQRSHRLCSATTSKIFLNVCHYIYILFKKTQKVEFQKY